MFGWKRRALELDTLRAQAVRRANRAEEALARTKADRDNWRSVAEARQEELEAVKRELTDAELGRDSWQGMAEYMEGLQRQYRKDLLHQRCIARIDQAHLRYERKELEEHNNELAAMYCAMECQRDWIAEEAAQLEAERDAAYLALESLVAVEREED